MMLRVDPSAAQPPYEQLKSQLVAQMTSGALPTGAKLPSVRRLAADLGIAPNTVARAYRELEHSGFVRTAGRNGTVVAQRDLGPDVPAQAARLAEEFASGMQALGLGQSAAVDHLATAWRRVAGRPRTGAGPA
ncbi:GntR family transcriptional regulator [Propionibacteriaceae bacterium Y1923]|uniref:GntR family transcriptional regulator n=1 Tax=Aestuariimicrobium sp. Y1814 TaxID=3418742 RepID=UPI003C24A81A